MARQLRERLERQSSLDGLARCFPFQALSVTAPVRDFYDFHGIVTAGGTPPVAHR